MSEEQRELTREAAELASVVLSVVVNAHAEGHLLRPTLRSVERAIKEVATADTQCELLIVLDNATASTRAEAQRWLKRDVVQTSVRLLEVSMGDPGASRNAGAENARGKFLAFCDGDDLVSRNYFSAGLRELERAGARERVILHPEIVLSFGARSVVWAVPSFEEVDHLDLIRENLWPSSSIARREVYLEIPYRSFPPGEGFGPEDYFWNIETSIAKIAHRALLGTMFFYRVRDIGGVNNRHLRSILPPFDVEALVAAMPSEKTFEWQPAQEASRPPSTNVVVRALSNDLRVLRQLWRSFLHVIRRRTNRIVSFLVRRLRSGVAVLVRSIKRAMRATVRAGYRALRWTLRPLLRTLDHSTKARWRARLSAIWAAPFAAESWWPVTRGNNSPRAHAGGLSGGRADKGGEGAAGESASLLSGHERASQMTIHLLEASTIEPALSWTALDYEAWPRWHRRDDPYPHILLDVVRRLGADSRAIIAVPWVGIGGADLVSLNYARALADSPRLSGHVTMFATFEPSKTIRELIPDNVRFVQMPPAFRTLTMEQQRGLLAQALLIAKPELVISVNCFDLVNSLKWFWRPLSSSMRIFATLFAFDKIGPGFPTNPITDDSQREYLTALEAIITDNSVTAKAVSEILAIESPKIRVHHQPSFVEAPPLRTDTRAFNDQHFTEDQPFRVMWPHRLDREKRPDALLEIARQLRKQKLPVVIEVHGQQVLSGGGDSLLGELKRNGVIYHGPYSGGLSSLPTQDYHAMLLTSEWEGLPLVLVQAMLLGLPVVSTAVGGVVDLIRHGETGLLVSGPEDFESFVESIRLLMDSLEGRRRLISRAYDFAYSQHDWQVFAAMAEELHSSLNVRGE